MCQDRKLSVQKYLCDDISPTSVVFFLRNITKDFTQLRDLTHLDEFYSPVFLEGKGVLLTIKVKATVLASNPAKYKHF